MKAMTLRLPDEIYEWLRRQAFNERRSMNELAIDALTLLNERTDHVGN